MNNCLVTKLKGTCEGSLPKYGTIKMLFKASESPNATTNFFEVKNDSSSAESIVVKVVEGNGRLCTAVPSNWTDHSQGVSELSISPNVDLDIYVTNADTIIEISEKYNIQKFNIGTNFSFNLEEVFAPKMNIIRRESGNYPLDGVVSAIESFPTDMFCLSFIAGLDYWNKAEAPEGFIQAIGKRNISIIRINGWIINDGSTIDTLLAGTSANTLTSILFEGNSVGGNLSYFLNGDALKFPNLTSISFSSYNTKFTYTQEDVAKLRSLGVTVTY